MHPACLSDEQLVQQCQLRRQRRSGPGGQHRNKVETAVVVRHQPSGIEASATERRSQAENRRVALRRLRLQLAIKFRTEPLTVEMFLERWRSRMAGNRIQVGARHEDFPALLADLLNLLMTRDADVRSLATDLGLTTSQLIRFLKMEPKAFELINCRRAENGLRRLR